MTPEITPLKREEQNVKEELNITGTKRATSTRWRKKKEVEKTITKKQENKIYAQRTIIHSIGAAFNSSQSNNLHIDIFLFFFWTKVVQVSLNTEHTNDNNTRYTMHTAHSIRLLWRETKNEESAYKQPLIMWIYQENVLKQEEN